METRAVTLRHFKCVHILVLVVPKTVGGFCANLLAAQPNMVAPIQPVS